MIRPIRKEKNSIYHDSFYQYKKKNSTLKWIMLITCAVILSVLYIQTSYAIEPAKKFHLNDIGSGQLLFKPSNGHASSRNNFQPAILLNSAASFEINGLIATVTLTQSFINQSDNVVNGLYAFPLPENSAVNHLHIQVADRIIEGKIMEKMQAKKVFQQAKRSGRKASLIEQHRPNLFTNQIANIAAHEQVTVTIKYFQHVDFIDGNFQVRFPMKITPKYQAKAIINATVHDQKFNKQTLEEQPSSHQKNNIAQVMAKKHNAMENTIDSIFTTKSTKPNLKIQLGIKLNAGVELNNITSPSHSILVKSFKTKTMHHSPFPAQQKLEINVGNGQVAMDRDFILQWQPSRSSEPRLSIFKEELAGEFYSLAMILPPTIKTDSNMRLTENDLPSFSRDITFIIDTSGSMQGQSIKQAKQSLLFALQTLSEADSFNIIAFESSYHQAFQSTVMATKENLSRAKAFISKLNADGGTEMYKPLAAALAMPATVKQKTTAIKQVIFITDGAVSNELALFQLIHNTPDIPRLFTVGIGSAPNGYFMRKAAQFGRGSYTYIGKVDEVKTRMSALLDKISRPALRNINLQFQPLHLGSIEQYPKKIPDLYYGEPLLITFKTAQMPTSLQVFAEQSTHNWHQETNLTQQQESKGITPIWARAKIEDLLDGLVTGKDPSTVKNEVLATSLLHQVMSPYSSFIAVEQEKHVENKQDSKQTTPFPKTAVGWQAPFFTGLILLILSLILQDKRTIGSCKEQ